LGEEQAKQINKAQEQHHQKEHLGIAAPSEICSLKSEFQNGLAQKPTIGGFQGADI